MHLLNLLPPSPLPLCFLYSFVSMNAVIQNRLWGLFFFFCIRGEVRVVQVGSAPPPPPGLAPCIPGSYSLLMSSSPFFHLFFSIAKYLALLHNPPSDFSPINPSTRPFLFHLPYFSRTLSSGLSAARSSSL